MKFIATATNISQAFKNAGRVREILAIFVRYGFSDIVQRMRLNGFLPSLKSSKPESTDMPIAVRLRQSFEELGPSFVKLGQVLASRSDLIPENYVEEFQKLQDNVTTLPFSEIKKQIESELKDTIENIFLDFDKEPLAAASIAQVHSATLKSGQKVAVKVQRTGIDKVLQTDLSILRGLAALLEKYIPESRPFNPSGLVDEFFKSILYELDFRVEANNIRKIKNNLKDLAKIYIPEVYSDLSTSKVLVQERLEGIRFSDRDTIVKEGISPMEIIETGCDAFFHMVMKDGVFHGDLHAGNLFVLKEGKIGIIDFGIVGRLSRRVQNSIITMFIAIMEEDYETLATEYIMLCPPSNTDLQELQKELMDTISPYVGMPLGEVNIGQILLKSTGIASKHHLVVPRELMLLFRALVTIDGLGKKLDPQFDVLQLGNRLARQVLSSRYNKERITRDFLVLGRDLHDTLETFPRLLKRFLRTWSGNHFAIETKNRDFPVLIKSIREFTYFIFLGLSAFVLSILGLTFVWMGLGPTAYGAPIWGALFLGLALYLLGIGLWQIKGLKK